jgi:hypothetical protein
LFEAFDDIDGEVRKGREGLGALGVRVASSPRGIIEDRTTKANFSAGIFEEVGGSEQFVVAGGVEGPIDGDQAVLGDVGQGVGLLEGSGGELDSVEGDGEIVFAVFGGADAEGVAGGHEDGEHGERDEPAGHRHEVPVGQADEAVAVAVGGVPDVALGVIEVEDAGEGGSDVLGVGEVAADAGGVVSAGAAETDLEDVDSVGWDADAVPLGTGYEAFVPVAGGPDGRGPGG